MQIVLAHVGWPWHLEAVAMALHKSNVYLDISGWKYRYLPDEVKREIPRRLRGQFCFGTDYPMFDPEACLSELDRLELPPDVANAVLRDNAARCSGCRSTRRPTRERMRELAERGRLRRRAVEYASLEHGCGRAAGRARARDAAAARRAPPRRPAAARGTPRATVTSGQETNQLSLAVDSPASAFGLAAARLSSSRRRLLPAVGLRLGARARDVQRVARAAARAAASASSRLRACERASWATAVTRGPSFALIRAFCASDRTPESRTSKTASIRDAVTFAC